MPTFQNRQSELELLKSDRISLLNVYGEAGIGKSRLLEELATCILERPPALVLKMDLKTLAGKETDRPERLLRDLTAQAKDWISGHWRNAEQVAGQVVTQLNELARRMPVVLMFDNTEVLQEDMDFWRWMEEYLVGMLVVEGRVRQIFAGRVPVPWRRVEVRRALKLLPLPPLSAKDAARDLVREVLIQGNSDLEHDESTEQAIDLILELSFGHPLLSEELALYLAPRWSPSQSLAELRQRLCRQVVEPMIEDDFFRQIPVPWNELMRWISVLDWFDVTILQRYLRRVTPDLVEGKPDYFFIQGITHLRIQNTVIWREERGDRLHGVIGDIVRHCFEIMEPTKYERACLAAAQTFDALADEFPEGSSETEQYRRAAEIYRQRV